jgi:hypothetical protein
MNYINKYHGFLNESRQNVFDGLSTIIIGKFKNKEYHFEIGEYHKSLKNRNFKIKNLEVKFNLTKQKYNFCNGLCDISKSEIIEDYLVNSSITFYIGYNLIDDDFIRYINSVVVHEVMHLYQVYNLKINNKFKPESWVIGSILPTLRQHLKEGHSQYILDLLYKSLPHEIYSQLQQYYFYKKDNFKYSKIEEIMNDLNHFKIKSNLNEYEIVEISNLKKFILRGLKNNNNTKYKKDADKSLWNENDIHKFLHKLDEYFKNKSTLMKDKVDKIDRQFDIETQINDSLNTWEVLPTNMDEMIVDHLKIMDYLIMDVLY